MSYSPSSGTTTPTTESTSKLTQAGTTAILLNTTTVTSSKTSNSPPLPTLPDIDSTTLTFHPTTTPKCPIHPSNPLISSQSLTTDHTLQIHWSSTTGWSTPSILPYSPLQLDPASSCLHYATECFEGMKVYRSPHDGALRLFRPELNAARFRRSAVRIALPGFDEGEFLRCLERFVEVEGEKWLPDTEEWRGKFLYLRPTMIGTGDRVGVARPEEALLFVLAVYMPDMSGATTDGVGLKLLASQHDMVRAWPGGFGFAKVGANYGPTLVAQGEAKRRGYDQVLWLFGEEGFVTEAGAANVFVLWEREGQMELVTPPVGGGLILEGVTRGSVLELVRRGMVKGEDGREVIVSERNVRMSEIVEVGREGRLREVFVCGTAYFVARVGEIDFRGEKVMLPLGSGEGAPFAKAVKAVLEDIMYGKVQHEWGYVIGKTN